MIWLSNSTLARLRDQLRHHGQRPSMAMPAFAAGVSADAIELLQTVAEYGPLCEAIAFADNAVADEENDVLNAFADGLGIDEERGNPLLDSVERDLN